MGCSRFAIVNIYEKWINDCESMSWRQGVEDHDSSKKKESQSAPHAKAKSVPDRVSADRSIKCRD